MIILTWYSIKFSRFGIKSVPYKIDMRAGGPPLVYSIITGKIKCCNFRSMLKMYPELDGLEYS